MQVGTEPRLPSERYWIMDCSFGKLSVGDVYSFLSENTALIVHFSGVPPMSRTWEDPRPYPEDLQNVIRGGAMGGICCSVVCAGDDFTTNNRNACGNVGVIVGLQCKHSLVAVDPTDCGSSCNKGGFREVNRPSDITVPALQKTLTERSGWNEWVVRDYVVLGIFFIEPYLVWRDAGCGNSAEVASSPEEISSTFPGQRSFTFGSNRDLGI